MTSIPTTLAFPEDFARAVQVANDTDTTHTRVASALGPTVMTLAFLFVVFSPSLIVGPA